MEIDNKRKTYFCRPITPLLTLICLSGVSISLMSFIINFVNWNGILGDLVNVWNTTIFVHIDNLLNPLAKWMGWNSKWITNYVVFGIFFYSLMLCGSKLTSRWYKKDWITITSTWPLGVISWPGLITLMIRSLLDDFQQDGISKIALLLISPFIVFFILIIVNMAFADVPLKIE